jgi:DNA polymerase III epsilon subunit family exonuclease
MTPRPAGVLDRLWRMLEEAGGELPLDKSAVELLRASRADLARKVLVNLVKDDPRFHVRGGVLALRPPRGLADQTALHDVAFAVLDFETNGLPPGDRAIEVGAVCFQRGAEVAAFETLIDPGTPVSPFVIRLTGIRPEDLLGKPAFEEVWPDLAPLLEGRVLVAHNLPFDRRILKCEVARLGFAGPVATEALCTLKLARRLLPKGEPKSLDALAERFGFEFTARHRALDDARVAGRLLYKLLDMAAERAPMETMGDLRALMK